MLSLLAYFVILCSRPSDLSRSECCQYATAASSFFAHYPVKRHTMPLIPGIVEAIVRDAGIYPLVSCCSVFLLGGLCTTSISTLYLNSNCTSFFDMLTTAFTPSPLPWSPVAPYGADLYRGRHGPCRSGIFYFTPFYPLLPHFQ